MTQPLTPQNAPEWFTKTYCPDWEGKAYLYDNELCYCNWRTVLAEIVAGGPWKTSLTFGWANGMSGLMNIETPRLGEDVKAHLTDQCQEAEGVDAYSVIGVMLLNALLLEGAEGAKFIMVLTK